MSSGQTSIAEFLDKSDAINDGSSLTLDFESHRRLARDVRYLLESTNDNALFREQLLGIESVTGNLSSDYRRAVINELFERSRNRCK